MSPSPADPAAANVTRALEALSAGDRSALDRLLPLVYDQMHRIAERELRRERGEHTLSPTALVHEAYLKLVQLDRITWEGRGHFYGACAAAMRRILISYARMHNAAKRGSGAEKVPLEEVVIAARDRPAELLALDEALTRLAATNPRQAQVVELRFFAGLDIEAVADALGVSAPTVKRDWAFARAWLNREMTA